MRVIRINLLPASYRPPRPIGMPHYLAAASTFAVVFAGTLHYRGLVNGRHTALAAVTAQELRVAEVKAKLDDAAALAQREEVLAEEEQRLKGLQGRTWSPVLLAMADLTPEGMSWDLVKAGPDGIEVTGSTDGLSQVAHFVTGLSASTYVQRVDLHEYATANIDDRYTFHLTVLLQGEEGRDVGKSG